MYSFGGIHHHYLILNSAMISFLHQFFLKVVSQRMIDCCESYPIHDLLMNHGFLVPMCTVNFNSRGVGAPAESAFATSTMQLKHTTKAMPRGGKSLTRMLK